MTRNDGAADDDATGWRTTGSRVVYENRWIRVREDAVQHPDGKPGVYGVVEVRQPAVFVVAVTDDDEVVLITQHRYTTGPGSVEVPAGGSDGQEPLVAAQRELAEETGLAASRWTAVGDVESLNGVADAPGHVFVAQGLSRLPGSAAAHQAEEGISAVRLVPFGQVLAMAAAGEIRDGESLAALALAGIHLGRFR